MSSAQPRQIVNELQESNETITDPTRAGANTVRQSNSEHNHEQLIPNDDSNTSPVMNTTSPQQNPDQFGGTPSITGPIRVPGTYPPEWLPDQEADACMACESLFTIIKRRHHCRSCGKIFCGDCCRLKAKILYLDNQEARVCNNCYNLIESILANTAEVYNSSVIGTNQSDPLPNPSSSSSSSFGVQTQTRPSSATKVQGVLKNSSQTRTTNDLCNISSSSSSDQHSNKQVIFSDGIRPGADLSEQFPYPVSSSDNSSQATFSLLTRQSRGSDGLSSGKKSKSKLLGNSSHKTITVCDESGYLPPIMISKDSPIASDDNNSSLSNPITNLIVSQFKSSIGKKTIQASMESRSCPLNGVVKFEEISGLVGVNNVITFLLLKDFYLKVKLMRKDCCIDRKVSENMNVNQDQNDCKESETESNQSPALNDFREFWCFTSSGLDRFGQNEIVLVIDKNKNDSCIPRDIFKIYLTLHELALRRQALENLGNLLFQDGLFGTRDTAGLVFVRPLEDHCLNNLVLPENKNFLVALVLQRWEVPWSKVFPMRLLLRLGHKYGVYPYPIISFKTREPVYYEVGHTIISILGDFRNFRYSITHVDGLKVILNKATRKVTVQLSQSNYQQFNKVLDSSNNEHVLAWSSCPFPEADGHLVSVQTDDGQYETHEFYKSTSQTTSFQHLESGPVLGASFIIFSGALKVNQTGQPAKISIVEDGLLIQIQSCTMSALRNAIHFMHHFDIDCGKSQL